jgi:hypothetical protein
MLQCPSYETSKLSHLAILVSLAQDPHLSPLVTTTKDNWKQLFEMEHCILVIVDLALNLSFSVYTN